MFKLFKTILVFIFIMSLYLTPKPAIAATYSYQTGIRSSASYGNYIDIQVEITGYNKTHVFTIGVPYTLSSYYIGGGYDGYQINYTLPDDGSNWDITGHINSYYYYDNTHVDGETIILCKKIESSSFKLSNTTPGIFTGVSIGVAVNAATAASTSATNALNAVSNVNGNTVTAVRDAGGTVLTEARQAKTNSQNAYNTAQTINTKVDSLASSISNLSTSINGVDSDNSEIAAAVKDPSGNTITAVRDANGTVLDASRTARDVSQEAVTKIDTLQTTVNYIENSLGQDSSAPEVKLRTFSGAAATSGNTIRAIINVSDNASTVFQYSFDGTGYQPLPADKLINLPVSSNGANLITVYVKDEAGNVGMDSLTIRKL